MPDPRAHTEDHALELDEAAMRALVDEAMARIVHHHRALPEQHAGYAPEALAGILPRRSPPPEHGEEAATVLDEVFAAVPTSFNTAGPGYLAYIPGGGIFASAVADLVAAAVNRFTGVWLAAPLLVELESEALGWLASMMGYPSEARGAFTSGGSMANFTALFTARRERLGERFQDGRIYVSDQGHHSLRRAAVLAGFPEASVVSVASDVSYRLRAEAVRREVAADRAAGHRPFLIAASAGTTNTGAVDELEALAELAAAEGLWLHVDAAYGGFFRLTREGRLLLAGIERADSIVLDPHKGLFLPYGTGALLVRDGPALRRAHAVSADYLPPMQEEGDGPPRLDFCEHSPELSRPFRGLSVWLPIRLHGIAPFRANLEEKLALARSAAVALADIPGVEVVAPPQLSTLAFRLSRNGDDAAAADRRTRALLARVLASGRVWLNGTVLRDRFVIRVSVLSFRTHADRVEECIELVRAAAAEL